MMRCSAIRTVFAHTRTTHVFTEIRSLDVIEMYSNVLHYTGKFRNTRLSYKARLCDAVVLRVQSF
jgi:hypothetical protein